MTLRVCNCGDERPTKVQRGIRAIRNEYTLFWTVSIIVESPPHTKTQAPPRINGLARPENTTVTFTRLPSHPWAPAPLFHWTSWGMSPPVSLLGIGPPFELTGPCQGPHLLGHTLPGGNHCMQL